MAVDYVPGAVLIATRQHERNWKLFERITVKSLQVFGAGIWNSILDVEKVKVSEIHVLSYVYAIGL